MTNPGIFWLVVGMDVLTALILSFTKTVWWLWVHGLATNLELEWDVNGVFVIDGDDMV